MTVYKVMPGPGTPITDKQAQVVGDFLEKKFGDDPITPEQYVAAAKPSRSPIHDTLEWDDEKAANEYRVTQARSIMRSIVIITDETQRVQPRAYHNVSIITNEGAHSAYVSQRVVWATEELAEQVVADAARALRTWQAKHSLYEAKLEAMRLAGQHVTAAINVLEDGDG